LSCESVAVAGQELPAILSWIHFFTLNTRLYTPEKIANAHHALGLWLNLN
jgi:hypothetical protein